MELNYLVAKLSVPFSRELEKCIKSPKKLSLLACFMLQLKLQVGHNNTYCSHRTSMGLKIFQKSCLESGIFKLEQKLHKIVLVNGRLNINNSSDPSKNCKELLFF